MDVYGFMTNHLVHGLNCSMGHNAAKSCVKYKEYISFFSVLVEERKYFQNTLGPRRTKLDYLMRLCRGFSVLELKYDMFGTCTTQKNSNGYFLCFAGLSRRSWTNVLNMDSNVKLFCSWVLLMTQPLRLLGNNSGNLSTATIPLFYCMLEILLVKSVIDILAP